jgi:acyl-CoA hydrolase
MAGHGEKLSHKQEQTIAALLTAPNLADAAHHAGIGGRTLLRWLKETAFQAAYREARRAVVQQAITQVQRATGEAVETLRNVMQDRESPASAKVSAAKTILETAVKGIEIEDLEARIAALEAQGEPR